MKTSLLILASTAAILVAGCASDPVRPARRNFPTIYEKPAPEHEPGAEEKPETGGENDGAPFIVRSPFGKHRRMDLTGMKAGTEVQDPVTGGIFKVPASRDEEPEIVSDPPADWKPEN